VHHTPPARSQLRGVDVFVGSLVVHQRYDIRVVDVAVTSAALVYNLIVRTLQAVTWALAAPDHVDVNDILIRPVEQLS